MFAGLADQFDLKLIQTDIRKSQLVIENKKIIHSNKACFAYIISSLPMILVAGLRYYVGTDYGAYYIKWHIFAEKATESIIHINEPGYRVICAFFLAIGINDGAYPVFVASAITIGLSLYIVYRNTNKLCLASILFFLIYWTIGFNAVRQCLAATFVFCGYEALRDKKIYQYLFWIGIGFLFHRSAICMLFPFFFIHKTINYKNIILLIIGCIIFLHSYDIAFDFTGSILDKEFNIEEWGGYNLKKVNRLRIIFNCAPAVIFFILTEVRKKQISYLHTFWLNILLFKAAISLSAMNSPYLSRMGIYFSPFIVIAYCGLINEISNNYRKILSWSLCICYCIFSFYEIYITTSLKNFKFIWQR